MGEFCLRYRWRWLRSVYVFWLLPPRAKRVDMCIYFPLLSMSILVPYKRSVDWPTSHLLTLAGLRQHSWPVGSYYLSSCGLASYSRYKDSGKSMVSHASTKGSWIRESLLLGRRKLRAVAYLPPCRTPLLSKVLLDNRFGEPTKSVYLHSLVLVHTGLFVVLVSSEGAYAINAMSCVITSHFIRRNFSIVFFIAMAVQDLVFLEISHRAFI